MAEPKKKTEPKAPDAVSDEWLMEGVSGDGDDEWFLSGVEGAEPTPDELKQAKEEEERAAAEAKRREEASKPIQISAPEASINSAANNVPFGRLLTDVATAGQLAAAPVLGRMLPSAVAARLPAALAGTPARLTPQARAELEAMGEEVPAEPTEPTLVDTYRRARDLRRARTELGEEQRPLSSALGALVGMGLSMAAPIPGFRARPGAGFFHRLGARTATGATEGAITGLTDGDTDLTRPSEQTALSAAGDAFMGGVAGGGMALGTGIALPIARSMYRGAVRPTANARALMERGVPLTTGQMDPTHPLAQFEEANTSTGIVGPAINDQREAARRAWQNLVLNEARAPGSQPLDPNAPIHQRLAETYRGFNEAYAPSRGVMVEPRTSEGIPLLERGPREPAPPLPVPGAPPPAPRPAVTPEGYKLGPDGRYRDQRGRFVPQDSLPPELRPPPRQPDAPEFGPEEAPPAFMSAVDDPDVISTPELRDSVSRFLRNQLAKASEGVQDGRVPSDRILDMRSSIRDRAAEAMRAGGEGYKEAALLENAERHLTDIFENSIPRDIAQGIRDTDRQYAIYKTVEDAVARSGDRTRGFTANDLSQSIATRMGRSGRYARQVEGDDILRDYSRMATDVLVDRFPVTGARSLVSGIPGMQYVTAPLSLAGTYPEMRRFFAGDYPIQQSLTRREAALAERLRGRTPNEAAARAVTGGDMDTQPQELEIMSRAENNEDKSKRQSLTPEMARQLALSEAIRRLQGGRQ